MKSKDVKLHAESRPFEVEARLLQELGERLVTSPQVALLELVKNASDADASTCSLEYSEYRGQHCLIVRDDGVGMSRDAFVNRWMRIATNSRKDRVTDVFKRPVTGQKGIGRFAVRFLGSALRLESVWKNPDTGACELLEAVFDWRRLDRAVSLSKAKVAYRLTQLSQERPAGTTLTIWRLKQDLAEAVNKDLRTQVLSIVSPISAFDAGRFDRGSAKSESGDPGFSVSFVGFPATGGMTENLASDVLEYAWARLKIDLNKKRLRYHITFAGDADDHELNIPMTCAISSGLHADIAFTPKRKDAFLGSSINRTRIWSWIRVNAGISVIDNGFRISPYGFIDDDWLSLNVDATHNARDWRSSIAQAHFPISPIVKARPALSPALNLAHSNQLVGAVFVSSRAADNPDDADLTPAMDRQGYLTNAGYLQMVDVVRGGLEFLAHVDKERTLRLEEEKAREEREALKSDLADTAKAFEAAPNLSREERVSLARHYNHLATRVEKQEDYDRSARQRLEIASGLGVVAGFMTHESERLFLSLDSVIRSLEKVQSKVPELKNLISQVQASREDLAGYIRYTRLYTDSLKNDVQEPFSALAQISWIEEIFGAVGRTRGVQTEINCDEHVMAPAMPVALYSAALLNLYTNATKAIIARQSDDLPPKILISAWNDERWHNITLQDTGVGIPAAARARIWDPFYSTTSRVNSPLGSGMGLGLPLVKDLVSRVGGKVEQAEPSPGFITSFQVRYPRRLDA